MTPKDKPADDQCVFCRIVAGRVPSRQIYADDHAYAFLDIAPWHRGHSLVIPRRHVADVVADPGVLTEIAPAVSAVAAMLKHRLAADGINLLSSAGPVAGQDVFHAHVHVIPRYADEPGLDYLVNRGQVPDGELKSVHKQITKGA